MKSEPHERREPRSASGGKSGRGTKIIIQEQGRTCWGDAYIPAMPRLCRINLIWCFLVFPLIFRDLETSKVCASGNIIRIKIGKPYLL